MNRRFNLLDSPWLPVRLCNGQTRDLGLLELFERAGQISTLTETEPPSLIAQYRLLLAIVHRALSRQGRWTENDRARWHRDGLPLAAISDYLEHWREHFWLFHPQRPFMQVAALAEAEETRDKRKPWTQISLTSATGNTPVVFDHACDLTPRPQAAADVLRALLGFLQFTPGGLIGILRNADKAGPLANTAAVMPLGHTLAHSLCLALHPATSDSHEDLPCWEREPPTLAQLCAAPQLASGPNDRYTRLTRAVLLLPDEQERIAWIRFAAGLALGEDIQAPDPMASYRAGSNGPVRLSFTEGRACWRDLPALLPQAPGLASKPATVLTYAANLLPYKSDRQPLLVAGLASDQAKLLRWRAERLELPAALLASPSGAHDLRTLIARAEEQFTSLRKLAAGLIADTLPSSDSKDTWTRARGLLETGPLAALYFAPVEGALGQAMDLLSSGQEADLDKADALWARALRIGTEDAWRAVCHSLGQSPKALRAVARHDPRLLALLRPLRDLEHNLSPHHEEPRA